MRFISSLTWIKRGVSKTPTRIKLEKDEMKSLFAEADKNLADKHEEEEESEEEKSSEENESVDEETKINRKYKLDNYDQEGQLKTYPFLSSNSIKFFIYFKEYDLKLDRLTSLACFPNNAEDRILTKTDDVLFINFLPLFLKFENNSTVFKGRRFGRRRFRNQTGR
jgi:hypothetical protein